jgi:hypothetical protein
MILNLSRLASHQSVTFLKNCSTKNVKVMLFFFQEVYFYQYARFSTYCITLIINKSSYFPDLHPTQPTKPH